MKKLLHTIFCLLIAAVVLPLTSCSTEDDAVSFDESLLVGEWVCGTLHERYEANHNGASWDTSDDATEQPFTWSLTENNLIQIHTASGANVPKSYTVITLDSSKLIYEGNFGAKTFTRVQQ